MNHLAQALQFGKYALQLGVLSQDQLNWALEQATQAEQELLVSDLLVESGALSIEQLEQVLRAIAEGERGATVSNDSRRAESGAHNGNGNGTAASPAALPTELATSAPEDFELEGEAGSDPDLLGAAEVALDLFEAAEGAPLPPEVGADTGDDEFSLADTTELVGAGELDEPMIMEAFPAAEAETLEIERGTVPAVPAPAAVPVVEAPIELAPPTPGPVRMPAPPGASETESLPTTPAPATGSVEIGVPAVANELSPARAGEAVPPEAASLLALVEEAASQGASDLHLHSGEAPRARIHGELGVAEGEPLSSEKVEALLRWLLTPAQGRELDATGQLDFSHALDGKVRLRCNAYRQQRGTDLVLRLVPWTPPTLEQLGLPETLARFADYHQGMVLFTGPSGCGKSSTLAALVRLINEKRPDHILTVEDPIEYRHFSQRANVNQRQVGNHTRSFARALKAALREDPDVIVIGELRDLETIRLALTAAETGHLVLGTMHTRNAVGTLNRLVGSFPPEEQAQIRTQVSESLRGIVSQRLARRSDGQGRVAALEILIATTAVANLVRESKTFQIPSILQSGVSLGMCLMDASLNQLLKQGVIDRQEALRLCENPSSFGGK